MKFYRLSDATFYDVLILYKNLLNLSWIKKKNVYFEEYGAFKQQVHQKQNLGPNSME